MGERWAEGVFWRLGWRLGRRLAGGQRQAQGPPAPICTAIHLTRNTDYEWLAVVAIGRRGLAWRMSGTAAFHENGGRGRLRRGSHCLHARRHSHCELQEI